MDLKKNKRFYFEQGRHHFSYLRKNKVKNKELFPGEFVCVFLLLLKVGKIQLWLSFTVQQFDIFRKVLGKLLWQAPSLMKFQIFKTDARLPVPRIALYSCYETFRSSHQSWYVKKMFLKISQNSQENTCARVSFL